jgi:hypothetical protein
MSTPSFSILKAHEAQALLCRKIVQEDRIPKRIRLVAELTLLILTSGQSALKLS